MLPGDALSMRSTLQLHRRAHPRGCGSSYDMHAHVLHQGWVCFNSSSTGAPLVDYGHSPSVPRQLQELHHSDLALHAQWRPYKCCGRILQGLHTL
jgi:hypothetical protein